MLTPEQRRKIDAAVGELESTATQHGVALMSLYSRRDLSANERERRIAELPERDAHNAARQRLDGLIGAVTDYSLTATT